MVTYCLSSMVRNKEKLWKILYTIQLSFFVFFFAALLALARYKKKIKTTESIACKIAFVKRAPCVYDMPHRKSICQDIYMSVA